MRVLHVLSSPARKSTVCPVIDTTYGKMVEHHFLFLERKEAAFKIDDSPNQIVLSVPDSKAGQIKSTIKLVKIFKEFDFIFVHYYLFTITETMSFLLFRNLLKRMAWVTFCGDLYEEPPRGVKATCKNRLAKHVKSRVSVFVGIFPTDIQMYKELYPRSKAKLFYARYFDALFFNRKIDIGNDSFVKQWLTEGATLIQIGHNGRKELNHISVLNRLSKYQNENIKLLIPMIEGEKDYFEFVKETSIKIFGREKVLCFEKPICRDDYYFLLQHVNVAIFDVNRPMAIGNIVSLILSNSKLFFPNGSAMYRYFSSSPVPVFSIESIDGLDYRPFIEYSFIFDKEKNRDFYAEFICPDNAKKQWDRVFKYILDKNDKD